MSTASISATILHLINPKPYGNTWVTSELIATSFAIILTILKKKAILDAWVGLEGTVGVDGTDHGAD